MTDSTKNDEKKQGAPKSDEKNVKIQIASSNSEDEIQQQSEEELQKMVTPTKTAYLSTSGEYSPEEGKLPIRVQSTHSLLGLVGLEGHEDDTDDYSNNAGASAVMDITLSPSTADAEAEDATYNTTPPGSVQRADISEPPPVTTYSVGSVNSASITESWMLQPRSVQSTQHHHPSHQESPQILGSPMVQQQPQPHSRPPLAPHSTSLMPGGNTNGPIPVPISRLPAGTVPESSSRVGTAGGGHARTPTDATNYSLVSSLTHDTSEYRIPRPRTSSWDCTGNSGRTRTSLGSRSLGGQSTSGSILQPILLPEQEMQATSRPPLSISASNLRRAAPTVPGPTGTTPVESSQNLSNGQSLALSPVPSLALLPVPSRENLHPVLEKLQNSFHGRATSLLSVPQNDEKALHPIIKKFHQSASKSSPLASTTSSTLFTSHLQDEKKDDETSRSHDIQHQTPLLERRTTDHSSSMCSSTTLRLQKVSVSPIKQNLGFNFGNNTTKLRHARCDLRSLLDVTKESFVETELIRSIDSIDIVESSSKQTSNNDSSLHILPYVLLGFGGLAVGSRGFVPESYVPGIFCLVLGVALTAKTEPSGKFFNGQVKEYYWKELLLLRKDLNLLNDIASLSTERGKESDSAAQQIYRFRSAIEYLVFVLGRDPSSGLAKMETPNRENFNEASQAVFETFVQRQGQREINFDCLCRLAKRSDDSTDESKVAMLSELFCPTRQDQVSKLDFVKATDRVYKSALLLIAKMNNASRIYRSLEVIANVAFYTIVFCFVPSIFGVSAMSIVWTLLGIFTNLTFVVCFTSSDYPKGFLRVGTRSSFDIGDRVHFLASPGVDAGPIHAHDDGPPSGGWIVESFDLYHTTFRHGITGESRTLANGSPLLEESRVVCWKRFHNRASVSLFWKLRPGPAPNYARTSDRIDGVRRQILEWIEARPHEWHGIESLRVAELDGARCWAFDLVLWHRESWHNYSVVEDSKSEFLLFLGGLQNWFTKFD